MRKVRTILRYLGTCDGNMEQGSLRCDVNISVRHPGDALGTRAEIKNINSCALSTKRSNMKPAARSRKLKAVAMWRRSRFNV